MAKLIVIGGISRVGKDSAANVLIESHGFRKVNMADFMKRTIEQQYGLPKGALELDEYRLKPLFWEPERTFLDLMVSLAKTWRESDPNCMIYPYYNQVTEMASQGLSVVTTGLRFLNELSIIEKIARERWFEEVQLWKVSKPEAIPKASDLELGLVWGSVPAYPPYKFHQLNNVFPTVEQWQQEIRQFYGQQDYAMETPSGQAATRLQKKRVPLA
jgi:hypothetical protein